MLMLGKLLAKIKTIGKTSKDGVWCVSCKGKTPVYVTGYATVDGPKGTRKRMLGTCTSGHSTSTFVAAST